LKLPASVDAMPVSILSIPRSCFLAAAPLVLAAVLGCSGEKLSSDDQVKTHLRQILMAYTSGDTRPRDMEDLRSAINDMHIIDLAGPPDEVLISPRDKQPIIVILSADASDPLDAILAYEQQGADGKRYVATMGGDVKEMNDADFSQAKFAGKHKPGS
jgi:hypothetical protein